MFLESLINLFVRREDNKPLGFIILGFTSSLMAHSIYTKILLLVAQEKEYLLSRRSWGRMSGLQIRAVARTKKEQIDRD